MERPIAQVAMQLEIATDFDFCWLLGEGEVTRPFRVAPDLASKDVLQTIRSLASNWLMISDDEVVGIISLKNHSIDQVEIGYGVASSRSGRGFASAAVAAISPTLQERGASAVLAETAIDNLPSQRVLQRNGFTAIGERIDDEDGALIVWQRCF